MTKPQYTIDKIKFGTDQPTFKKAIRLYEDGKVTEFEEEIGAYTAKVIGTELYHVYVEARRYDYGHCDCYVGEKDTLCKHQVALAIYAVKRGKRLSPKDVQMIGSPQCSGQLGELRKEELTTVKKSITDAITYIKAYQGPSRTWFAYQNSLDEGCRRLSVIVSTLPVSNQTADLVIKLLLRLDKKLQQGRVDDSNGTVGNLIEEIVIVVLEFAKLDPSCVPAFKQLVDQSTCFDWEVPLIERCQ